MSFLLRSFPAVVLSCAALHLTAAGCGGADEPTGVKSGSSSADDDNSDDSTTKPTTKADAGKTTSTKDAGAPSKGSNNGNDPSKGSTSDAGSGDKSPTGGGSSGWCDTLAILKSDCQSCHGSPLAAGAPMPLLKFDDVTANGTTTKTKKVYELIGTRVHDTKSSMPPGKPLSADKLKVIDAWIADGAKAGDDATCGGQDTAPTATADTAWPPEGCDQSYKILAGNGKPVSVPAGQEVHPQFTMDAPWGDAKVQAVGFRPITQNPKVLHHWILNGQGGTTAFISGWAPGQDDSLRKPLPADIGIYLPSGKQVLRMDMHYNNLSGTTAELDQSGVEVCVTKTPRKNVATTFSNFVGLPFISPGAETDIVGTCNVAVTQPVFLLSESPHAHKLATHMKLEVKRGSVNTVLHDAPFSFDGQTSTPLKEPFELKNGDQVITTCHFKNDTNQLVTFGEDTGNEMCFNFATYYPMGALSCSGAAPVDVGSAFGGGK